MKEAANREKTFWIMGCGRFGRIAASRLMAKYPRACFTVVDLSVRSLGLLSDLPAPVRAVQSDAAGFLADNLAGEDIPSYIVPAVPVHLAYEWLKRKLQPVFELEKIPVPEQAARRLPNPVPGGTGTLYSSYADFVCPDNCPEPESICTVTRQKRKGLLYRDYLNLNIEGFVSLGIRSVQLAPGVGGYKPEVLWPVLEKVRQTGTAKDYLLSTACLCHGVMDAFRLRVIPAGKISGGF
ncbi:MAG: hypothetical protein K6T66_10185 [Peptococcaceae bacterium]|nr:hypothetical protein [Peptococcaceae bacterium]